MVEAIMLALVQFRPCVGDAPLEFMVGVVSVLGGGVGGICDG
jgi:hypothetical protein